MKSLCNTPISINYASKIPTIQWEFILFSLCLYEGLITFFNPNGLSIQKVVIVLLMLIPFVYLTAKFVNGFRHKAISKKFTFFYVIYLCYCLATVFRSFEFNTTTLFTLFGKHTTGLSLFLPMMLILGGNLLSYEVLLRAGLRVAHVGIFLFPLALIDVKLAPLCYPFVFISYLFIPFWHLLKKRDKILLMTALLCALVLALLINSRTMILKIMLETVFVGSFLMISRKKENIVITVLAAVFLIIAGITFSKDITAVLDQREIHIIGITIDNDKNRGWLYEEVLFDLVTKDDITYGRGATGKYFSSFFYNMQEANIEGGDDYVRFNIEVGALAYLLKGGLVLLILTFVIFIRAVYLSLFKSSNNFSKYIGLTLLIHTALIFVENYPKFLASDVITWFFVGSCFTRHTRSVGLLSLLKSKKFVLTNSEEVSAEGHYTEHELKPALN